MPELRVGLFAALLLTSSSTCQVRSRTPDDLRIQTLEPRADTELSELIVFGYPVSRTEVRGLSLRQPGTSEPIRLTEIETTIHPLRIIKGAPISTDVRYRFYDIQGEITIGPPKGPSGNINARGLFFLRRGSDSVFRAAVDVFRPDIPTPWLFDLPPGDSCTEPTACVAALLLTYHQGDDSAAFAARLLVNVAISRTLVGFVDTFELLNRLANTISYPIVVNRSACLEILKWYELETPSVCHSLIGDVLEEQQQTRRSAKLKDDFRGGGILWVERRIGSNEARVVDRYLKLLSGSGDPEVRAEAQRLRDRHESRGK
jgi:hypothetical protein